ncbi:MAG TPA: ABC transporter ATP-binding protein [Kofleriaceae bacterium]|nr:ABC transporter ATP-binding protein [Kofleriaceae bacterium]
MTANVDPEHLPKSALPLLRIRGVTVRFGAIVALNEVSFEVNRGEILGLIGPNGAGKTTLFNCLSRLSDCECGAIELEGRSLLSVPRHEIAQVGIGRTFQHVALFDSMSVLQNVMVGNHVRGRGGFLADALRLGALVRSERHARDHARELLERMELTQIADVPAGLLPFAIKKRVELARALACKPKLLLLDEPAGGLNHEEVGRLGELIRTVRTSFGVTILMVEHHLNFVMKVSDRVVALDFGKVLAEGSPAEMQRHPEVIRAYLGTAGASS